MDFARSLAHIELQDTDGEPIRLPFYWEKRPVVLAFIRHFG